MSIIPNPQHTEYQTNADRAVSDTLPRRYSHPQATIDALTARVAELQARVDALSGAGRMVCEGLKFREGDTYEIMVRRLVPSILAFQMLLPEFSEQLRTALAAAPGDTVKEMK